jgi:anthranilate phosphoribosyltransferase
MPQDLKFTIGKLAGGEALSADEAEAAFTIIMSGDATPAQIGALLMAMRLRGETVPEITGAVRAMRARMTAIEAPEGAIDVCGTGGDGAGTLNVSSAVTFVVAACGVPVAKHGNRALSSRTGGADVLTALGINIDAPMDRLLGILRDAGAVFLFAPRHHPSMRHAAGPRVELGTRTIFNILGPLSNPARVAGENQVTELKNNSIHTFSVTPEDAGLARAPVAAIKGGDAAFNAEALLGVLRGAPGAYRDTVLLNAAAALIVSGRAGDLRDGVDQAAGAIASGAALNALETMRRVSMEA